LDYFLLILNFKQRGLLERGQLGSYWLELAILTFVEVTKTTANFEIDVTARSYNLRERTHSLQLPEHSAHLSDCNFMTHMLYKNTY